MPVNSARPSRKLLKLCVFLLLLLAGGAIINVAVAWGFAVMHPQVVYGDGREPLQGQLHRPASNSTWLVTLLAETGGAHLQAMEGLAFGSNLDPSEMPSWSQFRLDVATLSAHACLPQVTEMARGWPRYSLTNRVEEDTTTGQRIVHDAYRVPYGPPECRLFFGDESFLPLKPIWPGFAINTIFYAALLWLLIFAPGKIRRLVRIRRGCCPACGYKIAPGGGIGPRCSECGAMLPSRLSC